MFFFGGVSAVVVHCSGTLEAEPSDHVAEEKQEMTLQREQCN